MILGLGYFLFTPMLLMLIAVLIALFESETSENYD